MLVNGGDRNSAEEIQEVEWVICAKELNLYFSEKRRLILAVEYAEMEGDGELHST